MSAAEQLATVTRLRPGGDWQERLVKKHRKGVAEIVDCSANAVTCLAGDEAWEDVLAWDEFKRAIVCRGQPPWYPDDAPKDPDPKRPWSDTDGGRVQNWLRRRHGIGVSKQDAYFAALMVAEANSFDPVIDYFATLEWDEVPRVDRFLPLYLGTIDSAYTRFVGRSMLVASVARALVPGSKVDTMPIWEGPQGIYKSQAAAALYGPDWFSDTPLDLASKDRFVGLRGLLCHEMAELDGWGRADAGRVKSFLSSPSDDYRPPYGQHNIRVPRRCVMLGTVNPGLMGYLVDGTGNRRMHPVICGVERTIDLDGIGRDRAQIWAEARNLYGAGPRAGGALWWPVTADERRLCNAEQEDRLVAEPWVGRVEVWLKVNRRAPDARITVREIMTDCLGLEIGKQDRGASARVGACLAQLEWVVVDRAGTGTRERYYARKMVPAPVAEDEPGERSAIEEEPVGAS